MNVLAYLGEETPPPAPSTRIVKESDNLKS